MNKKFTLLLSLFCGLFLISSTIDLGNLFNYTELSLLGIYDEKQNFHEVKKVIKQ